MQLEENLQSFYSKKINYFPNLKNVTYIALMQIKPKCVMYILYIYRECKIKKMIWNMGYVLIVYNRRHGDFVSQQYIQEKESSFSNIFKYKEHCLFPLLTQRHAFTMFISYKAETTVSHCFLVRLFKIWQRVVCCY